MIGSCDQAGDYKDGCLQLLWRLPPSQSQNSSSVFTSGFSFVVCFSVMDINMGYFTANWYGRGGWPFVCSVHV